MNARASGLSLFAGLALLSLAPAQAVSMITHTDTGSLGYYGEPFDCVPYAQSLAPAAQVKFEFYGQENTPYFFAFGGLDVCRKIPGIEGGLILGTPLILVEMGVFGASNTAATMIQIPDDFPTALPFRFQMLAFAYDTWTPTFSRGVELVIA